MKVYDQAHPRAREKKKHAAPGTQHGAPEK
jgi:hypothetical protein